MYRKTVVSVFVIVLLFVSIYSPVLSPVSSVFALDAISNGSVSNGSVGSDLVSNGSAAMNPGFNNLVFNSLANGSSLLDDPAYVNDTVKIVLPAADTQSNGSVSVSGVVHGLKTFYNGTSPMPSPVPDAVLVSQDIPDTMVLGESYNVSVTLRNTGNVEWSDADRFSLGSCVDADSFGDDRFYIVPGVVVPVGGEYTWNFSLTAPSEIGDYYPAYRMVWEDREWFGEPTTQWVTIVAEQSTSMSRTSGMSMVDEGVPDAAVVSENFPAMMTEGVSYDASVTMRNTGDVDWISDGFHLGGCVDADSFVSDTLYVEPGVVVAPGDVYTWNFTMTAPMQAGTFYPAFRMMWDEHECFGDPTTSFVKVVDYTLGEPIPLNVTIDHNGQEWTVPVVNDTFTTTVDLTGSDNITVYAVAENGTVCSDTLLLDGDYLPMQAELAMGFNPLNPDSDSTLTTANESGNGILDGYEVLNAAGGEKLPAFVKYLIGGDPLKVDSNDNGLSDYFELVKLGIVDVSSNSTDEMALPGEDPDNDGLTNLQEQSLGTDPLVDDTDHDGLKDGYEVNVSHTNPLSKDSDNDGLQDDSELRLGTDPNNPDSNTNGILDGNETYTSKTGNSTFKINVSVTGKGDLASKVTISNETSEYYTNISGMVSPLMDLGLNGSFNSARISMQYDPSLNASNLSLCYFNESLGLYVPVSSQVDAVNHTISANTTHFSMWAIFDVKALLALYKQISDFNHEAYYGNAVGIPAPGDNLTVPYDSSLIVTFVMGDTAYNDHFGLWSPVNRSLGTAHGTSPGTVYDLGNYTNGTRLTFYLVNDPGNTWLSGPGSNNPDGVAHAYIKPISDDTYNLGWEDLYGGGDRDYNDVILNITFVRSTADSDGDGLPDYMETHGIMDNLGHTYVTNATNSDTDYDGLNDSIEVGLLQTNANGYIQYSFNVTSDPTKQDGDNDGISDADELDIGTNPLNSDTDGDGIPDGRELLKYFTDPSNADTDGDGYTDAYEIYNGALGGYPISSYPDPNPEPLPPDYQSRVKYDIMPTYPFGDPLVYEKRTYTQAEMYREFKLGAIFGDYKEKIGDGVDHNDLYYLIGQTASSLGVYGDVRDTAAGWDHQAYASFGFGLIALGFDASGVGDLLKALGKVLEKEAMEAAFKAFFRDLADKLAQSASEEDAVRVLRQSVGDATVDTLNKDFTDEELVGLVKDHEVNLFYLKYMTEDADLLKQSPRFIEYMKYVFEDSGNSELQAWLSKRMDGMGSIDVWLKVQEELGEQVDASLLRSKVGYLANIKGGYGEYLAYREIQNDILNNGYKNVEGLALKIPTSPGPDFIFKATKADGTQFVKVVEVKARQRLSIGDLKNYIINNLKGYNIDYAVSHEGEEYFMDASGKGLPVQLDIYIYGDNSADLASNILSQLPTDKTLKYNYMRTIEGTSNEIKFSGDAIVNVIPGSL